VLKKKIWANFQRIIELFTQKIVTKLSKTWIWDPRSGIRKKPIPDPGSRGQKGTGSRIRVRNTGFLCTYDCILGVHYRYSHGGPFIFPHAGVQQRAPPGWPATIETGDVPCEGRGDCISALFARRAFPFSSTLEFSEEFRQDGRPRFKLGTYLAKTMRAHH
jgi:hypothetical protein